MKKYFILFPNDVYAIEWYAKSKKQFLAEVRNYFGLMRLPRHTQYWGGAKQ